MITVQDWIGNGYRRYNQPSPPSNLSDFLLQKCIRDEVGKKYFINVWVYEHFNKEYFSRVPAMKPVSFSPEVQFCKDGDFTTNIELILSEDSTVSSIEQHFESFWLFLERPYYEKYH